MPLTLVIANKNYSSWSLRAWLVMRELGIPFAERMLKFDSEDWAEQHIAALSPTGTGAGVVGREARDRVSPPSTPARSSSGCMNCTPRQACGLKDARARARARSLVAEFHAGYATLRQMMPMNMRSRLPGKGMNDVVGWEVERLCTRWRETRSEFGGDGPFLFGAFCAADASYAPVASRFVTYGISLDGATKDYQQVLLETQGMRAWTDAALRETEFVAMDEPYAKRPGSV